MSIYKNFCTEEFDTDGRLIKFELKYSDNYNFGYDVVDRIAEKTPDKRALVWCNTEGAERVFTFGEISKLSNKAANVFLQNGIKKGDKVLVILKRHYEYWIAAVALHKIGAVLIPVTHMLTVNDMVYRFNSAKVSAVITTPDDDVHERVLEASKECNTIKKLWTVQKDKAGFRNFNKDMASADDVLVRQETKATEPILLYFTSGTTGYPKGVIHDHTYTLAHIVTARYWQQTVDGGLHFTVAETGWAKSSWGKIYGQWLTESAIMVFDFDNFDPKQLITIINRYKVTTFCAPPTVYRYLVKKGVSPMPDLKHACTAGEALNPEVFKRFEEKTGLQIAEGFGQTESTLILGNLYGGDFKPGSMGKETPFYKVAVLKDDGTFADCKEVGELVIIPPEGKRQVGIFCEYLDNEAMYKHVWRGGVYHTGDTVWKDEEGYFWFNGRIDDVIKTGGFRVGPFEIENVAMQHPAIMECAAVGIPDDLRGQAIKLVAMCAPGVCETAALAKEIKEFCNKKLAEYKWVRYVEFVEEMPKTISGKIRKIELKH